MAARGVHGAAGSHACPPRAEARARVRFPIESRGRRKKLYEVGCVTAVCSACFTLRALIVAWSAVDAADADLDVLDHPLLNFVYYAACELLPSALVLYILRKLPPRPAAQGYQQVRA